MFLNSNLNVIFINNNKNLIQKKTYLIFNFQKGTLDFRKKLRQSVLNDTSRIIKTPFINKISVLEEKFNKMVMSAERSSNKENYNSVRKMLRETKSQLTELE
jgi:hypothetical protein